MPSPDDRPLVRAVLFDLDGVLVDSYEVWFHLLNATARAFGADPIARDTFASCWGQGVAADVERFFTNRTLAETEAFYHAHFMDQIEHLRIDPQAVPLTRELTARGVRLAVVTNTPSPLARRILAHAALAIDTVVGGDDVPRAKPAPDMIVEACRRLKVSIDDCVVLGDSEYDARAASAAGTRFVGFRRDGRLRIEALDQLTCVLRF